MFLLYYFSVKGPCVVCGAPGLTCHVCESPRALYCTTAHRLKDWGLHKNECQRLAPRAEVNNNESDYFGRDRHLKLLFDSVHGLHVGAAKNISESALVMERHPWMIGPVSVNKLLLPVIHLTDCCYCLLPVVVNLIMSWQISNVMDFIFTLVRSFTCS